MDSPPKLYDLAFKVVVDCYKTGLLQTEVIPADSIVSEQIFNTVMRVRGYWYDDHTKDLIKEFNPTKLELNVGGCVREFSEIRDLKLTELKIRNFGETPKYVVRAPRPSQRGKRIGRFNPIGEPTPRTSSKDDKPVKQKYRPIPKHFAIAQFLGDILSEETKRELRVLDIAGYKGDRSSVEKWMEAVSYMFPKLEVLNISGRVFSEEDFEISCNNLPNLQTLRIGHDDLKTLKGISKLKNLRSLAIDSSHFSNKEDVEELLRLENLESLSFSSNSGAGWNYDFYFDEPLPALRHLEIKWWEADDDFLRRILPKLPKLEVVVANHTKIQENTAPPSVTVYTSTSLNAIMKSVAYFRINGNGEEIMSAMEKLYSMYYRDRIEKVCTPDQLSVYVNEMEAILETFKFDEKVVRDSNRRVTVFADLAKGDGHFNVNKLKIVSILLNNLKNYLKTCRSPDEYPFNNIWFNVDPLIGKTENLMIDKIAALAMKSIILGGGRFSWEHICVGVLEKILDEMDLSSEFYKNICFRKFHECLSGARENAKLFAGWRESIGDILRYIELFM